VISVIGTARIRSGNLDAGQEARAVLIAVLADPERAEKPLQSSSNETTEVCVDAAYRVGGEPEEKHDACAFLPR